MQLRSLVGAVSGVALDVVGAAEDVEVHAVVLDSRAVTRGALFCCVRGSSTDGHDHAAAAVAAGAVALLVDHELDLPVAQVTTDDVRAAVGPVASALHGNPSRALAVVGATGTNGKTTVTHLLAAIARAGERRCDVIGTLSGVAAGPPTTPDAPDLQARLAQAREAGADMVAMEVSSHALAHERVRGTRFAAAIFTNLGRDHLDFHGTVDDYFAAKAALFTPGYTDLAVVNGDDQHGRLLADRASVPTVVYRLADAEGLDVGPHRSTFVWRGERIELGLGGRFNVANGLAAATCALELGLDTAAVAAGLREVGTVAGRWERIDVGQDFTVLVDYAHTPDALAGALDAAREVAADGHVTVVFGAGGDKDTGKRPAMGEAVAARADRVVLTSDNPRSEDPLAIIEAVRAGIPTGTAVDLVVEPDRRAAIAVALAGARTGDVVLIAGKGHEDYQEIDGARLPFDDRAVARELLEASR